MKENIRKLKVEVANLKRQLNELNIQKEQWFSIKENLKKDISDLIKKIRLFRSDKEKSDKTVRELKEKRDKHNKEVQELIKKFKELNSQKQKILKDKKISFNPSDIIKKIEDLEFKLETEAISFEKEKQIMRQINAFKKQLNEVGATQDLFKQLKSLSEKITFTKSKAEEYHNKLKQTGRTGYKELMEMTKQINEVKKKQEDAFNKFIDSKNKFSNINEELKSKLRKARDLNMSIKIKRMEEQEEKLEERAQKVEEKLKKKQKLTTEDLMIFQNTKK